MERIKIDLDYWKDAPFPIKTDKVNQKKAEEDLYIAMRQYGYDDEYIENFFNKKESEYTLDDEIFDIERWTEEEIAILNNGGIYYEDLEKEKLTTMEKFNSDNLCCELWHKRVTLTQAEEILTKHYGTKITIEMPDEQNSPDYTFYYYDESGEIDGTIYALPTREIRTSIVYLITEID